MSYFGKNIKKIRALKKLSQSAFADLFDLKRASVGAYEEGRSEAKIDTIIDIAKYFSLTIEQLLVKELTVNEIIHFDPVKAAQNKAKNRNGICEIKLINLANAKNYIKNRHDKTFLENLPSISLPEITPSMRAFEHSDCEMNFAGSGIFKGDILVCKKINELKSEMLLDKVYVYVFDNDLFVRRLVSFDHEIVVKTDNQNFELKAFAEKDLFECWQVQFIITKNIGKSYSIDNRFNILEQKMDLILSKRIK